KDSFSTDEETTVGFQSLRGLGSKTGEDEESLAIVDSAAFSLPGQFSRGSEKGQQSLGIRMLPNVSKENQIASWERHTKGLGSKFLMKMGWKPGSGIGADADRQGIKKPVEIKVRPKGMGLGFDGYSEQEKSRQKSKNKKNEEDEEESEEDEA